MEQLLNPLLPLLQVQEAGLDSSQLLLLLLLLREVSNNSQCLATRGSSQLIQHPLLTSQHLLLPLWRRLHLLLFQLSTK